MAGDRASLAPCGLLPGTSTRSSPAWIASWTGSKRPSQTCWPSRSSSARRGTSRRCRSRHSAMTSPPTETVAGMASHFSHGSGWRMSCAICRGSRHTTDRLSRAPSVPPAAAYAYGASMCPMGASRITRTTATNSTGSACSATPSSTSWRVRPTGPTPSSATTTSPPRTQTCGTSRSSRIPRM